MACKLEALTVRRPIGDNKVGLLPVEVGDDLAGCHAAGDVALYLRDALYGRHRLQIHRYDLWGALWPAGGTAYHHPSIAEDYLVSELPCVMVQWAQEDLTCPSVVLADTASG